MSENTENLVLEHLAPMQRVDDMTTCIGHLETSFAHEQSIRFDRVEASLARVGKRLELADA